MELTIQQKIDILEGIDIFRLKRGQDGLCYGIAKNFENVTGVYFYSKYNSVVEMHKIIDLFTRENGKQFGAKVRAVYWFDRTNKGYEQRRKFRDWMVAEYKKQLEQLINVENGDNKN